MTIENPDMRRVMFRFLMDLARSLARGKESPTPVRVDRLMVLASVALGTIERRPFKAQKLADYTGMARTTVLRRLADLEEEGWIEYDAKGHVLVRPERINGDRVSQVCDRMSTLIHRAHYELLELERKENKTAQSGHCNCRRD